VTRAAGSPGYSSEDLFELWSDRRHTGFVAIAKPQPDLGQLRLTEGTIHL
jgi:hypothetical protein